MRARQQNEYRLSETDREAYAYFRGNVAAVERARSAVVAGRATAAGAPVPQFLVTGWARHRRSRCGRCSARSRSS